MADALSVSRLVEYEVLEKVCPFKCDKCKDLKPLRTHHCSVCNHCVMLMDHHCMWTNSCIGVHNYKYFLQLNMYGILGCMFTAATLAICDGDMDYLEHSTMYYIVKIVDILIGKVLLLLFAWNMYLCLSGFTHIEYKSIMEDQISYLSQKQYHPGTE